MSPVQTILTGGLVMGSIDILKNIVFLSYQGRPWTFVLHYVAGAAIGREAAFAGGLPTAMLGLFFHFLIAFTAFTAYYLASRKLPVLIRHPFLCGPAFGIAVFCFMRFVVIPLSTIGWPRNPPSAIIDGVLTHILCVGLPTSLIVREAARRNAPVAGSAH